MAEVILKECSKPDDVPGMKLVRVLFRDRVERVMLTKPGRDNDYSTRSEEFAFVVREPVYLMEDDPESTLGQARKMIEKMREDVKAMRAKLEEKESSLRESVCCANQMRDHIAGFEAVMKIKTSAMDELKKKAEKMERHLAEARKFFGSAAFEKVKVPD